MSRMGADGYSSKNQTQLSARIPEGLKRDFRDACDKQGASMTEVIQEQMKEYVAEHGPIHTDSSGYVPSNPEQQELYEACLEHADHTPEGPKLYHRRHARLIAQETRQVSKDELPDALMPLRRTGYVALGPVPLNIGSQDAQRWLHWYIKPRCADPQQWKYRENK